MKVLVADDHYLVLDGLVETLKGLSEAPSLIATTTTYAATLERLGEEQFDYVFLDLNMPDRPNWRDALPELVRRNPNVKVVAFSGMTDAREIRAAMELGATSYIPKGTQIHVLQSALNLILSGGMYIPPEVMRPGSDHRPDVADFSNGLLTARQQEVLVQLCMGKSNKDIARALQLAEGTVKLHVTAILKALNVNNRTQAVTTAQKMGLVAA
jgi:DNA-binding NarL/FixJ family response regulator